MIAPTSIEWSVPDVGRVVLNADGLTVFADRLSYSADEIYALSDLAEAAGQAVHVGEAPVPAGADTRTVVCRVCGRSEIVSYRSAKAEGWRCGGFAPLWWVCPSCAAVDDAIERDVDDAIDRSAS